MNKKGFTIVESLASIAILVTAIIGTMSAVQTGISSYIFSKDQITAFYLAQEGFEQIRNLRDQTSIWNRDNEPDRPWLYGISASSDDPCYFGNACTIDAITSPPTLTKCSAPGSCPALRQSSTGFFGYNSSWSQTNFRREIVLTRVNDREVIVTVTVDWSKGAVNRQFKARENLLNW